ncbi:MAG: 5-formyltetrahydrofolate cyclo-ligase [Zhongshania sp.]|uniref:5-formyltetrahydrofolate cyclo-ligase n=1 Tax=Zhongshania sp. TaxID=1971902 RepID=UPI002626BCC1|nr:5-formyltetrahydrofolate cyclo-ligase [Zhongshania sp.]MDF1692321.1 5-formyltetrahydrofolate cyclo-ligase [Zhongshania sp.]
MNSALKNQLRQSLRARRRQISAAQQQLAAQQLMQRIIKLRAYRRARHIAAYQASDGEISPALLLRHATLQHKTCYLPRIHVGGAGQKYMSFQRYHPRQALRLNRYGIGEPAGLRYGARSPKELDIVLVPLAGFDKHGGRLGMGGGFYDRCFAFKNRKPQRKPLLIGIAHHSQEVSALPIDAWDIGLDVIVTDRTMILPRRGRGKR